MTARNTCSPDPSRSPTPTASGRRHSCRSSDLHFPRRRHARWVAGPSAADTASDARGDQLAPRPVSRTSVALDRERCQSGVTAYARRTPFGSIAVARPSERAVRTESDTVRTTPVQVIAQAATVAVPTNTAVGTVKSRVRLTAAADAFTAAHR